MTLGRRAAPRRSPIVCGRQYSCVFITAAVTLFSKLVRFAHNWNNGIVEYWARSEAFLRYHGFWDHGMLGLENHKEYNCIDFLVIVPYFPGRKQKMDV